ncbi:uncharacterized protein LOC127796663 isoform X1 [Diospyros lotus]|uniref:uncharacterized protein LOC127796663 isoform X1 n=1 Tax=Diospyros lotus TaxID=55363 RepID=UPI0022565A98|nr:uncharacterized protein LOC127796663 isoform X1 [Diospyros lotus]XP_052184884.1 uncharacterized protein LOC127796663 isoform X1 [Diospyros lotus]
MTKDGGHLTDGEPAYGNPSRIEPKRSHQWFADGTEPELFLSKKQAVENPISKSTTGMLNANIPLWENAVPSQFMGRLFVADTNRPFSFTERNFSLVVPDDPDMRRKGINEQYRNDSSVDLSISNTMEDPETCLSYGGIRKVKVNQVKDTDNSLYALKQHNDGMTASQAYNPGNEMSFISMGQVYSREHETVTLMGHTYNKGETALGSLSSAFEKEDVNISFGHSYSKAETNTISFDGFQEEPDIDPLARPLNSYELIYDQSSVQATETPNNGLDASTATADTGIPQVAKSKAESVSKNKSEQKMAKKEAPNSFPSNVKSLISTGMFDGVPVKYVSLSREELRGIIKGNGYLCGCQSCNFSKVLNAYKFESHAGCKTKHPNNHIYFESGKTIYQIVQELKSTPENQLFDAIQTVTGSPINQKSFRIWKESFQAATRELQRIYGKEELNP